MTISDYYKVLGLDTGSTVYDIKNAYRKKARECHPDINPSPDAKEAFIRATEAYDFLLTYREKIASDEEDFHQAMEDWRKYRQDRSRHRAKVYAQASYLRFKKTSFYKTTRIIDRATIISSLAVSIMVLVVTILGYIYRIHHPLPGVENPPVSILIAFILFGMVLLAISLVFLKAYIQTSQKNKNRKWK
jgi:hypothetical protein